MEKSSIIWCFCLTTFLTHFYLWFKLHLKNLKFLFAFKTFSEDTKRFLSYQICSLTKILELIWVWRITKETSLFSTEDVSKRILLLNMQNLK